MDKNTAPVSAGSEQETPETSNVEEQKGHAVETRLCVGTKRTKTSFASPKAYEAHDYVCVCVCVHVYVWPGSTWVPGPGHGYPCVSSTKGLPAPVSSPNRNSDLCSVCYAPPRSATGTCAPPPRGSGCDETSWALSKRSVRIRADSGKPEVDRGHAKLAHFPFEGLDGVVVRLAHSRQLVFQIADGLVLAIEHVLWGVEQKNGN